MKQQTLSSVIGNSIEGHKANYSSPFHKGDGFFVFSGSESAQWDVPLPENTADVLNSSQAAVAAQMGAAYAFFTTCGARTALLAVLQCFDANETLLLLRSCNSSSFFAAMNCNANIVTVQAGDDAAPFPDASQLEKLIEQHHAKAVLLSSPNIYGQSANIPSLADAAHRHCALLLVDGSLGASIPYTTRQNPYASADIWYHDLAFSLRGMTQCGCIFLNNCSIPPDQLKHSLDCLLPETPSTLLLAAADWAVYMGNHTDWDSFFTRCINFRTELSGIPGISLQPEEQITCSLLSIDLSNRGITGFEARKYLLQEGLSVQFADQRHIVLLLSPCDDLSWDDYAIETISRLPIKACFITDPAPAKEGQHSITVPKQQQIIRCPITKCIGKYVAEPVSLGVHGPVFLVPGETVTRETAAYLQSLLAQDVPVNGIQNETLVLLAEDTI